MGKRGKTEGQASSAARLWNDRRVWPGHAPDQNEAEEIFANRPFKKLDASGLEIRKSIREKSAPVPAQDEPDRDMFLKALAHMESGKRSSPVPGFTLADRCPLPEFTVKKQKKDTLPPPPPAFPREKKPYEDDENAAFLLAMRKTRPLKGKGRDIAQKPALRERADREQGFEELLGGQLEFTLLFSDEYLEGKAAGLDELIMNRLREGQMSPEAHLDLHGLNAEQAFEAMRIFIRDAWFKSLRVVLLVPGRGKNSPAGLGILRRKVQEWLTHEPFKRVVLAFCTARPHDGGPGSIYVLLRKFRKKGHISWDKLPADADLYNF